MAKVEKVYFKVNLTGEVVIEAADESGAIAESRDYFVTTGKGLSWAVTQVKVQVNPPPPV